MLINPRYVVTLFQFHFFITALLFVWLLIGLRRVGGPDLKEVMRQINTYKQAEALFVHALFWPLTR
ncbi:MAG: hypothetical protein AAGJ73_13295 [Pseudomonadota bacterium]